MPWSGMVRGDTHKNAGEGKNRQQYRRRQTSNSKRHNLSEVLPLAVRSATPKDNPVEGYCWPAPRMMFPAGA